MRRVLLYLQNLLNKDIIKVSLLNGLGTFFRFFSGIITIKVVSSIVGPLGMALLGQLNNFITIIQSIATGGIATGVTRYISENIQNSNKVEIYIGTAIKITFFGSLFTGLILLLFGSELSIILFNAIHYIFIFRIFALSIVMYAFNTIILAILNGYKQYQTYIIINTFGSVINLLISIILSVILGLDGALLSVVTYQSIVFIIAIILLFRSGKITYSIIHFPYYKFAAKELFQYSIMTFFSAMIIPLSQLIVRGFLVKNISVSAAGMWEGMNRISNMYLQVIITSLSVYYLPRLAELNIEAEYSKEVKLIYRTLIPFLLFTTFIIYVNKEFLISFLFSNDFLDMKKLFSFQLIGDIFKISGWILGYIMVAKAMVIPYIITEIINYGLFIILSIILIGYVGIKGTVIAYAISHAFYLLIMIVKFRNILFIK